MSRESLPGIVVASVRVVMITTLMLVPLKASAVDVHVSPRMWYTFSNINLGVTDDILNSNVPTISHVDQVETPLVGLTVLVESDLDLITSFFWGSSSSEFIFVNQLGQTPANFSFLRTFGKVEIQSYDAEVLVRWRPKDSSIYLVTGLRYYHFEYVLKSRETIQIPGTDPDLFPPATDLTIGTLPDREFTQDLILWEIGGGLHSSITQDAKHRLIASALIGLGYSRQTIKSKAAPFFVNPILVDVATFRALDEVNSTFALSWDVNVGYQWQFHPRMSFVGRYRAFGKSGTEARTFFSS